MLLALDFPPQGWLASLAIHLFAYCHNNLFLTGSSMTIEILFYLLLSLMLKTMLDI